MAREWALAGVSEEELQPPPPIQQPQTPQGKWENFWFYHKWKVVIVLFIACVLGIVIHQAVTRDDPDYFVVFVTDEPQHPDMISALQLLMQPYGEDLDGDGKVEVLVENLYLSPEDMTLQLMVKNNQQTLTVHLASADRMLFMFEQSTYDSYMRPIVDKSSAGLFADVNLPSDTLAENGTCWDWYGSPLQQNELINAYPERRMPEHVYFGVRGTSGIAEGQDEEMQQAAAFLQSLVREQTKK